MLFQPRENIPISKPTLNQKITGIVTGGIFVGFTFHTFIHICFTKTLKVLVMLCSSGPICHQFNGPVWWFVKCQGNQDLSWKYYGKEQENLCSPEATLWRYTVGPGRWKQTASGGPYKLV